MTSTEGILDGAAKARVLEAPKVAPEAACMPMKAAADSLVKSFIFLIIMMMCIVAINMFNKQSVRKTAMMNV